MNVYREAAEAIKKYGWIQNDFGSTEEGFCLLGAIGFAAGGPIKAHMIEALGEVIDEQYLRLGEFKPSELGISYTNDAILESADEAITLLEKAAVKFDEQV